MTFNTPAVSNASEPALTTQRREASIIESILEAAPPGVPVTIELKDLTAELIALKQHNGSLRENPLSQLRDREVRLAEGVETRIRDKVILITGGAGCVGQALVRKILSYRPRRIVIVDRNESAFLDSSNSTLDVRFADVRFRKDLETVFQQTRPEIVFHLAAQRLVSRAHTEVSATIGSNVFGSQHIIDLCQAYGCHHCIFSSTGKATNYYPTQVYAQTKKLAEWQFFKAASQTGPTYSVVRFTHIVENSWILRKIEEGIQQGFVGLHSPYRSFYVQGVEEATHLLLNALALADRGRTRLHVPKDIGWPIDLLELALHRIKESGKQVGIFFTGIQPGYEEHEFRGTLDWSQPARSMPNPMLNALESTIEHPGASGLNMVVANHSLGPSDPLATMLSRLTQHLDSKDSTAEHSRDALGEAVRQMTSHIFSQASPIRLLELMRWGTNPHLLRLDGIGLSAHRSVFALLVQSLVGRIDGTTILSAGWCWDDWATFLDELTTIPECAVEAHTLKAISLELQPRSARIRRFPDTLDLISE
ncbi:MAG: polysaccharide biosynthesis protein [Nitrospirota bacterium]